METPFEPLFYPIPNAWEEEYVPFFGPDLMPARQIFGNKRRRRRGRGRTRNRRHGTRTYRCTYRKTIRGSKMKTVGRMPAGRVTRRKISSKLSKRYFARMGDARKPISSALFVSPPPPALLNLRTPRRGVRKYTRY